MIDHTTQDACAIIDTFARALAIATIYGDDAQALAAKHIRETWPEFHEASTTGRIVRGIVRLLEEEQD